MPITPEVTPGSTPVATGRGRGPGKKLEKGQANAASGLNRLIRKEKLEALERENAALRERIEVLETAAPDPDADISTRTMRKVWSQKKEMDVGPSEERFREWLERDVKGFKAAIEEQERVERGDAQREEKIAELEEELKSLRPVKHAGPDKGAAKSRELLEGLFASFSEPK